MQTFLALITGVVVSTTLLVVATGDSLGQRAAGTQRNSIRIVPTSYLELVAKRIANSGVTAEEAANYANTLLAKDGFDYEFDACPIVKANRRPASLSNDRQKKIYNYSLTKLNGGKVKIQLVADPNEALCGECSFWIPLLRVTKRELLLASEGRQYLVKRPEGFLLKKINLVNPGMTRVLRTWEVPLDTDPVGVSEDGSRIYLELLNNYEPEALVNKVVLEVSQSAVRFLARRQIPSQKSELIQNHPTNPRDAYLTFKSFRVGNKSYIIRYDAPCT